MPELPSESDLLAYMEVLHDAEASGARSEVVFGPYTAMLIIGALQLATRHPGMTERQRTEITTIVDQFRPWFAGTPGEIIIDRGNDPGHDQ